MDGRSRGEAHVVDPPMPVASFAVEDMVSCAAVGPL
jgi:hypothetical protein